MGQCSDEAKLCWLTGQPTQRNLSVWRGTFSYNGRSKFRVNCNLWKDIICLFSSIHLFFRFFLRYLLMHYICTALLTKLTKDRDFQFINRCKLINLRRLLLCCHRSVVHKVSSHKQYRPNFVESIVQTRDENTAPDMTQRQVHTDSIVINVLQDPPQRISPLSRSLPIPLPAPQSKFVSLFCCVFVYCVHTSDIYKSSDHPRVRTFSRRVDSCGS